MADLEEYRTQLEDIEPSRKSSRGGDGLVQNIMNILKKYKCNVIIAGSVLLILFIFKPKFVMKSVTTKNGVLVSSLSIAALLKWWIILSIILSIGLVVYNKLCKSKGKSCNVCKGG